MEDVRPNAELKQLVQDINSSLGLENMHIELSSDKRLNAMIDYLVEYFFPHETMCKSVGLTIDDTAKQLLLLRFSGHLSLLLIDDVTDDIIGVRTMTISRRDEPSMLHMIDDEKVKLVATFIEFLYKDMTVFKKYDVDTAIHFLNLGVHPDFRNKGLASKLMDAAMLYCKQLGLKTPCVFVEATSIYSQKIFMKLGFDQLNTVEYEDYKVDGDIVFKDTGNTKNVVVFSKKL